LERSKEALAAQGLGICSVSYDSVEILRDFATRRGITFPMLADPGSVIIRRFGLFNDTVEPTSRDYGIPHPGLLVVDAGGIVRERFFEERYFHRMTMPSVLTRLGTLFAVEHGSVAREHLRVRVAATQQAVHPGNRFTLFLEIIPADRVHVYAPEVGGGYQGLDVGIDPLPYLTAYPAAYPPSHPLRLPWTNEPLAGYEGSARVAVDVALGTRQEMAAVLEAGQGLRISGTVRLQACDDRVCWAPDVIPVEWHLDLIAPDLQRAPEPLQHKPKPA
jgi:hypothetical protein